MVYLEEHLKKYPLMQIEDVLKLYLQGILGPAHLVSDFDKEYQRINDEYQSIKDLDYHYELIEEISDEYVRIYIKPYFELNKDFKKLIEAFILSSKEKQDIPLFIKEVKKLVNEKNKAFLASYLDNKDYLISHSEIYKNHYHPHYLIIHKKYLDPIK